MSDSNYISFILSLLLKKTHIPTEYHNQIAEVKRMLQSDSSGIIDSLLDYAISAATVNFYVETNNPAFNSLIEKWLFEIINADYKGQVPRGITALAQEYYKERWKSSSFPVLKIVDWKEVDKYLVPSKIFFVDGESIYSEKKTDTDKIKISDYNYFLGSDKTDKLGDTCIITKPYERWYTEYPTPYLIKRGIYLNWKIINNLKSKQIETLDQIIPYLMLVQKGTEALATTGTKKYTQKELEDVKTQLQDLMTELRDNYTDKKVPLRVSQFDEEIKHLIPDLKSLFATDIFTQAEKNLLAGLGFVDIAEAVSSTRRESVLNPKPFIAEIRSGVDGFKEILSELIWRINDKNVKLHPKYTALKFSITNSPIKGLSTDDFKGLVRSLYDRGLLSKETTVELIGEVEFDTEVRRRTIESKKGLDETLYPPIIVNSEEKGTDFPSEDPEEVTQENVPDDKKGLEKKNYNMATIEAAPYAELKDLSDRVKNSCEITVQRIWMKTFNSVYNSNTYKDLDINAKDVLAAKIAWSQIRKMAKKSGGKWTLKSKYTKASQEALQKEKTLKIVDNTLDTLIKTRQLEIKEKQSDLLDKLLDTGEENENI